VALSKTLRAQADCGPATAASSLRLFLISTAALYLEIVLIRWLGTEVKIFAFFQNLSLIACFLGFGLGCFGSKQRGSLIPSLAATTALVTLMSLPFKPWHLFLRSMSSVLSYTPDAALWGQGAIGQPRAVYLYAFTSSLLIVMAVLMLLCIAMIPMGRWVGHLLETAPNTVRAYSINLLGSLAGIWLLAILAFVWLSPPYWFIAAFLLILVAQPFSWRSTLLAGALLAVTLLALKPANGNSVYWSPYQKLTVTEFPDQHYQIDVNNEGYMSIANLTPAYLSAHPQLASDYQNSSYDSPFQFSKSMGRVLVVGSGAGNDVAAALRHGAAHVDAVEIDPLIAALGRRLHPEQPYASPKVRLINNDARNYMRETKEKYDTIVFGLLDSHTEFSGYSNMRVDNYVYTEESFREARRLLNKDGVLILKFEVRKPWTWIGQRFYTMLSGIFPRPPLTYYAPSTGGLLSGTVFIESDSSYPWEKAKEPQVAAFLSQRPPDFPRTTDQAPTPTTDDWPYVYHFGHSIPRAYYSVSAVILVMALYMVGPFFKPKESSTWQFFLLGAGFLLMETQLVSRLALYFGTTWLVNCVALTGILTVLLLANLYVERRPPGNLGFFYACLCAALIANYLVPWHRVHGSGAAVGTLICIAYCVPFFFAGIIFTESFRRFAGKSSAFGANMLGAVAGGLAQNLSFILGMKALLLIAAVLYAGAALVQILKPKSLLAIAGPGAPTP
jgi:spermidine synthase